MARYIDADKLWNDRPQIPEGKSMDFGAGFSECMWGFSKRIKEQIDNNTADVVPKSEVVLKIIGEILSNHTPDVDGFLMIHKSELSELKKKYIPQEKSCCTCRYLVTCEPNPFGVCDGWEKKKK